LKNNNLEMHPNSFNITFNILVEMPDEIVHISIFDVESKPIETIEHSAVKSFMDIGSSSYFK